MKDKAKVATRSGAEIKECPACGQMSFPPLFQETSTTNAVNAQEPSQDKKITDCPACGQMSFDSFNSL